MRTERTGPEGYARFWVTAEAEYDIEARLPGFKTKRVKSVRLGRPSESSRTAYVQIRLPLAARGEMVW